jgi:hypothetical protein
MQIVIGSVCRRPEVAGLFAALGAMTCDYRIELAAQFETHTAAKTGTGLHEQHPASRRRQAMLLAATQWRTCKADIPDRFGVAKRACRLPYRSYCHLLKPRIDARRDSLRNRPIVTFELPECFLQTCRSSFANLCSRTQCIPNRAAQIIVAIDDRRYSICARRGEV